MAKKIELNYVNANREVETYHPVTDVGCVEGLPDNYVPKTGSTMRGEIDMDGHAIRNLPEPVNDSDLVTMGYLKNYVDNTFLGGEW